MEQNQILITTDTVPVVRNHKWEEGDVESVELPTETYGECSRNRCFTVGELGNGVCQSCWDKGLDGRGKKRGLGRKKKEDVPIIIIE